MHTLNHLGYKVNYSINKLGNTIISVRITKDFHIGAIQDSTGEVYTVYVDYSNSENSLQFGIFGNGIQDVAPWLPLLQPIFAKIALATTIQ